VLSDRCLNVIEAESQELNVKIISSLIAKNLLKFSLKQLMLGAGVNCGFAV
jgi:hypothetical protein